MCLLNINVLFHSETKPTTNNLSEREERDLPLSKLNSKEQRASYIAQAQQLLTKPDFSKEDRSRFDALMQMADSCSPEADNFRIHRLNALLAEDGQRKIRMTDDELVEEFRKVCSGEEHRALDTTTPGAGYYIPQLYRAELASYSYSAGPFFPESEAVTSFKSDTGAVERRPLTPDTASGYIVGEDTQPTELEPAASNMTSAKMTTFSSGRILASTEVFNDAALFASFGDKLMRVAGNRLSRIANTTFIPSLKTAIAATTGAGVAAGTGGVVSADDIFNVVYAVGEAYRQSPQCAFVMSSYTAQAIAKLKGTDNRYLFKFRRIADSNPLKPAKTFLLGYPVHFVDSGFDAIAAGKSPLWFGDLSYVYIRSLKSGVQLQTLTQTYAEFGQVALILRQRASCDWAGAFAPDSPVKMLNT